MSKIAFVGNFQFAEKDWQADLLVIIYESYPFLSDQTLQEICDATRRSSRLLIDQDGKYLKPILSSGDTNHSTPESYKYWTGTYDFLSDKILQPFWEKTENSKVQQFLYFGIDKQTPNFSNIKKVFDLLYLGNNWYRWTGIKELINSVSSIRDQLKVFALIGQYWTGKPMKNFEEATKSDPDFLVKNNIKIYKSPKYGEEIKELTLSKNVADDILRIMERYDEYVLLTENIRKKLQEEHSYEVRIKQLLYYL